MLVYKFEKISATGGRRVISLDIHYTPGRIRIRCQTMLDLPNLVDDLRGSLSSLQGVERIAYNPRIGSMKIVYNQLAVSPVAIFRQFQRHGVLANVIPLPRFALRPASTSRETKDGQSGPGPELDWSRMASRLALQLAILALPFLADRYLGRNGGRLVRAIL